MTLPLEALGLPIAYQAWKRVSRDVSSHIDGFSRVRTYGYTRASFLKHSYACHLIKWSESEPCEWRDAQRRIHYLTEHPEEIAGLSSYAIKTAADAGTLQTFGKFGRTDFVRDIRGHIFVYLSGLREVPKEFRDTFANPDNWWPLRAQLSFFPGGGSEVPDVAALSEIGEPNILDEALHTEERSQRELTLDQVRNYRQRLIERHDLPVSGLIQLGRAQVQASRAGVIANGRFVTRYVLMSTTSWHVLDGDALWLQAYDLATNQVTFIAAGVGCNPQQVVDDLNNHICGLIFGTKLHGFAAGLELSAGNKLTEVPMCGSSVENGSAEEQLGSFDEELGSARRLALLLDCAVPLGALTRLAMGPNVVTSPPLPRADTAKR